MCVLVKSEKPTSFMGGRMSRRKKIMERKLVTLRKVSEIKPIENADFIELVRIDGWQCVVKKGDFKFGDIGLYFEIDSFLPIEPRFEFLRKSCYKKLVDGTEGFRLKTVKLKGCVSQGLLLPLSIFPDVIFYPELIGKTDDYSGLLGVIKYEPPLPANLKGMVKGLFPSFIKRTDQERCQNLPDYFELYKDWEFEITEKLDGCLHYNMRINTDIGQMKIGVIVNQRKKVKILSYNEKLNINEFKEIKTYFKYPQRDILYNISIGHRGKGNRPKHIYCTENHHFYTQRGWIKTNELKKTDLLYHRTDKISYEQEQVILGTLLGDSSIRVIQNCKFLSFVHSVKQSEYFDYKKNLLGNLMIETTRARGGFKGSAVTRRAYSISTLSLNEILSLCLIGAKRTITKRWGIKLSPISLAFWYMDDGSIQNRLEKTQKPTATLATNRYSFDECKILSEMLLNKFNIHSNINGTKKGYVLKLTTNGSEIFFSLIAPYVCSSMKYKLPLLYQNLQCIYQNLSFKTYDSIVTTKILDIERGFPKVKDSFNRYVYDLEIKDNHNYFAHNILTHNSSATFYWNNGVFGLCSRNLELKPEDEFSVYSKIAKELNLKNMLGRMNRNIALQGEIVGEGINKNPLKIRGAEFHVFDIYDIDLHRLMTPNERNDLISSLANSRLKQVPVIKEHSKIFYSCHTIEQMLEYAKGKSKIYPNAEREGLVFKSCKLDSNAEVISFKAVNNDYLLEEK